MRISSRVSVGSPTFRLASIVVLTVALVLALGAAVVTGASMLPNPAPHVLPPYGPAANGALVYEVAGDIGVADADGSNPRPIITGPTLDSGPWFSHDGTRIAFARKEAIESFRLMVARADGTEVVPLTVGFDSADWSPDGHELVVTHLAGGRMVMSLVPADGLGSVGTLDLGSVIPTGWVRWRPTDGTELIFKGQPEGSSDVHLYGIRPDGTGLRTIGAGSTGDATLFFQEPHLSPDGSTIGYSTWGPNDAGVSDMWSYLRDLGTGQERRDEEYSDPRFSPDGSQVVGEAFAQLMTAPADGSEPAREIGPARGAWFQDPDGNVFGVRQGPVPAAK